MSDLSPSDVLLQSFAYRSRFQAVLDQAGQTLDLQATEIVALLFLGNAPASVSDIASAAGLRPNGGSVLVERLRSRGLVERSRASADRRVATVALSGAGRGLSQQLDLYLRQPVQEILADLSDEDQVHLSSLIDRLVGSSEPRPADRPLRLVN